MRSIIIAAAAALVSLTLSAGAQAAPSASTLATVANVESELTVDVNGSYYNRHNVYRGGHHYRGNRGVRNRGYSRGYSNRGVRNRGYSRGYSNRGFRNRGHSNRSFRNRGYRNNGYRNRGYSRGHGYRRH